MRIDTVWLSAGWLLYGGPWGFQNMLLTIEVKVVVGVKVFTIRAILWRNYGSFRGWLFSEGIHPRFLFLELQSYDLYLYLWAHTSCVQQWHLPHIVFHNSGEWDEGPGPWQWSKWEQEVQGEIESMWVKKDGEIAHETSSCETWEFHSTIVFIFKRVEGKWWRLHYGFTTCEVS